MVALLKETIVAQYRHRERSCALRQLTVILAVVCGGNSVLRADDPPQNYGKLQREFRAAYDQADYDKALKTAQKMHDQRPDDVTAIYNIACIQCLKGEKAKAYEWLEKAVDAGYDDANQLRTDSDFRTIRGEDRFRKIVRRVAAHERGSSDEKPKRAPKADEDDEKPQAKPKHGEDEEPEHRAPSRERSDDDEDANAADER
jgi:tetratricopeptide (TPR) repeat protein